jgi:beta-phosphoglucomutase
MTHQNAVLWDLDGVLVDSRWFHYQTWKEILPQFGVELSLEKFDHTFGLNNMSFLREIFGDSVDHEFIQKVSTIKEARFRNCIKGRLKPLPGAVKWLDYFKSHSWQQFIASSAPMENITVQVREAGLFHFLDGFVSGSNIPGKPAPDVFLLAAAQAGVAPSACLVIEDAPAGITGAHRAGMPCIAVQTTHPKSRLLEADLVVSGLEQLEEKQIWELITVSSR